MLHVLSLSHQLSLGGRCELGSSQQRTKRGLIRSVYVYGDVVVVSGRRHSTTIPPLHIRSGSRPAGHVHAGRCTLRSRIPRGGKLAPKPHVTPAIGRGRGRVQVEPPLHAQERSRALALALREVHSHAIGRT
jgi:hypothetical protein